MDKKIESILHNYSEYTNKIAMPIYQCDCGVKILSPPDISAIARAINNHLPEHKKLTGKKITEETLPQKIIALLSKNLNQTKQTVSAC
jgi:hypothetical protein